MKRWGVWYTQTGEVEGIALGIQKLVGTMQTPMRIHEKGARFYCDAIDELGALARFMEAWEKYNA
jgi:hypothetical protein